MGKREKDFFIVVLSYLIGVIAIAFILPINRRWAYVSLVLIAIGYALQWYWNRHFKKNIDDR